MRWSLLGALVLLACAKASAPDVAAPLVVAPVPREVEDAKLPLATSAALPTWPTHAADLAWVRTLPKAKQVARAIRVTGSTLGLTWRMHPSRRVPGTENEKEEYAGLYQRKIELVIASSAGEQTIDLGLHSGYVEGGTVSACERAGFRHTSADWAYEYTDLPGRVAFWEMGTMQGGSEVLVLLGADRLHVLRRHTHDGACPVLKRQGPLEVCEDMTWEQLLEIPVTGEPRVSERAVDVDVDGLATPIDCKSSYSGQDLAGPDE